MKKKNNSTYMLLNNNKSYNHHERGRGEERGKVRREDKPSVFTRVINTRQVSWPPRRSISHAWHPATAPGNRARQVHPRVPTKQHPGNLQARSSPGNFSQGCIQTDPHCTGQARGRENLSLSDGDSCAGGARCRLREWYIENGFR